MKTKIYTKIGAVIIGIGLILVQAKTALATEVQIFSNETKVENANKLILDNDNTTGDVTLQFGATLAEQIYWDASETKFVFTDDVNITGNLDVDGIIYAGSGDNAITDATGLLDGEKIGNDTIDDDSIDFGMGADQVGADDITMTDEFGNSDATNVQDVMDDLDAAISGGTHTQNTDTGSTAGTFTLDSDNTGGTVSLIFGTAVNQYLSHDGTLFHFSDDVRMDVATKIEFRDDALFINSSGDGQLDIDADAEVEITAPTVDLNGNLDVSGNLTGATIDDDTVTLQNIDWTAMDTRVKTISIDINDATISAIGGSNAADMYIENETGDNPHQYYLLKTLQAAFQNLTIKIKVKLPEDFVSFANATDLSFTYKNTGANSDDSKIDILVEDDGGNDAYDFAGGAGKTLFNAGWTAYTDELDAVAFDPDAGEYIYITITGYATYDAAYHSPYMGEIVLTYTGR